MPRPSTALCESECSAWIASATARQLQLRPDELYLDYAAADDAARLAVTAAPARDIIALLENADALGLKPDAITPDACALGAFLQKGDAAPRALACEEAGQWLWATRMRWGVHAASGLAGLQALCQQLGLHAGEVAVFGSLPGDAPGFQRIDPLRFLVYQQPPLPKEASRYAVALGLAMGDAP